MSDQDKASSERPVDSRLTTKGRCLECEREVTLSEPRRPEVFRDYAAVYCSIDCMVDSCDSEDYFGE
jgi:hypothetical protein